MAIHTSCIIDGEMTTSDVMLHALPLYHCAQLDVFLGPAVYLGMTSTITSEPSPDNILALLEKENFILLCAAFCLDLFA